MVDFPPVLDPVKIIFAALSLPISKELGTTMRINKRIPKFLIDIKWLYASLKLTKQ